MTLNQPSSLGISPDPSMPQSPNTQPIDSKTAFELVFGLLQDIPWLVRGVSTALPDIEVMKAHQAEAVNAILWICETGDLANWPRQTHRDAQATASYLLTDLAFQLLDPASPCATRTWDVAADQPRHRQALQVVHHEILRSKPISTRPR
ncbi:MAG: hypothetical protein WA986_05000 [Achromobacter pulmonis]